MIDTSANPPGRTCPTCGASMSDVARFCPNCGTRITDAPPLTAQAFEDAIGDVIDDQDQSPPQSGFDVLGTPVAGDPPEPVMTSSGSATEPVSEPAWTATPDAWRQPPPAEGWTATTAAPVDQQGNRTLWIVLAIFGFIVFCCCATLLLLFAVSSNDTAFQTEISHYAAR